MVHNTSTVTSEQSPGADSAVTNSADVVVIGFGPVGATLAGLLARRGRSVIVIDREVDPFPLPRAAHVDAEAMRILQEVGCGDEIRPSLRPNPGMDFLTADHRVLISMRSGSTSPYGWSPSSFMFQPEFERHLRGAVARSGVQIRLGSGARSIEQDDEGVVVGLDDGTSLRATYVIGCDGARSFTRQALGITMRDLEFEEPWLVVDLVVDAGSSARASLPDHALQICDPRRPHTVVPMPDPRFRFEFMLLAGESADEMQQTSKVHELLMPWLKPGDAEIERSAVYTFHGLVAESWREGRVLLAGDAAHQMPPFLGQGMCSGLRDAANLAWKLDAVLGGAPTALLDTYQEEREPHVQSIIDAAVGFGRIICTTDHEIAAGRDAAMLAAREAVSPDERPNDGGGVPLAPLTGPLVTDGGGTPSRQPRVDGLLLDDHIGRGWAVITRTDAQADIARAIWASYRPVVMSSETHPEVGDVIDGHRPDRSIDDPHLDASGVADADGVVDECVVIRPDRYVYGRGAVASIVPPTALIG